MGADGGKQGLATKNKQRKPAGEWHERQHGFLSSGGNTQQSNVKPGADTLARIIPFCPVSEPLLNADIKLC